MHLLLWVVFKYSICCSSITSARCDCYSSCLNPQGAARRLTTQKKDIEVVESVGASAKSDFKRTVKYFRAEVKSSMFRWRKKDLHRLNFSFLSFLCVAVSLCHFYSLKENKKKNDARSY